jgi:hypothetical protein
MPELALAPRNTSGMTAEEPLKGLLSGMKVEINY